MPNRAWVRVLVFATAYSAVAVWVTWPLAAHATTDLPNPFGWPPDVLHSAWLLAWHAHALVTDPRLVLHPNIFHPTPRALFYGPPCLGALPIFAPVYLASGSTPLAYDVTFLLGLVLAALGVAEVVRRWTGSAEAAFVAGLVLVSSPQIRNAPGTTPPALLCAMLAGVPWLIAGGAERRLGVAASALLVGALVLQGLVEPIFATLAPLVPLGLVAASRLIRRTTRRDGAALAWRLGLGCALLSPLLLGYAVAWSGLDPAHLSPWNVAAVLANPKARAIAEQLWPAPQLYVGRIPLALMAAGALLAAARGGLGSPGWRHAMLWTVVGLGYGLVVVPFAFRLVLEYPALRDRFLAVRSMSRMAYTLLVSGPLLLGLGLAEVLQALDRLGRFARPSRGATAVATVALVLVIGAPRGAYPTYTVPSVPPEVRAGIVSVGGPVLELPARTIADHTLAAYRSIGGWWPVLNGYASFWPPGFNERMEAAQRLPDAEALRSLVATTGLQAIVVHVDGVPAAGRVAWLRSDAPERAGLVRIAAAEGEVLFAVAPVARMGREPALPAGTDASAGISARAGEPGGPRLW